MATVAGLEEYFTHSGTVEAARRSAQAAGEVRRVGDAGGAEIAAAVVLDFGPLRLPKVNILARKWSKDDPHSKTVLSLAKYRELALDAEEVEASNREKDGVEDLKLLYARDTHLDNPELAGQHLDDELKRVSDLYPCKGPLKDRHIRAILDKKPAVNSSNYGMHRTKPAKHSAKAQFHTTKYARRTVEHLVKITGGLTAWKVNSATTIQPVRATASGCIETAKWKKFWKSLFVGMMVTSITLVTFTEGGTKAEKKPAKKDLFAYWRAFEKSPNFYHLRLGTVDDVPTRPTL
ncbi:hypothetical protein B0A54_02907 [Friedmanniomyces endolithicus]|uniref:Uncharacterized protein n=1 Tax=Friedmanniomyces endolithicus TaxID=329885 RepID=A0A4U0VAZ9_9PEZI|nr:hypothetical protein B0A54_02907 [Friedmanniomyces endolithicus]